MDSYRKAMDEINPNNIPVTGTMMCEEPILLVESIPRETAVIKDQNTEPETSVPGYMAPREIKVKRYILKK